MDHTLPPLALSAPTYTTWLIYVRAPHSTERVMIDARRYVRPIPREEVVADFAHLCDSYELTIVPDDGVATIRT